MPIKEKINPKPTDKPLFENLSEEEQIKKLIAERKELGPPPKRYGKPKKDMIRR
jgi:hypothetical protein